MGPAAPRVWGEGRAPLSSPQRRDGLKLFAGDGKDPQKLPRGSLQKEERLVLSSSHHFTEGPRRQVGRRDSSHECSPQAPGAGGAPVMPPRLLLPGPARRPPQHRDGAPGTVPCSAEDTLPATRTYRSCLKGGRNSLEDGVLLVCVRVLICTCVGGPDSWKTCAADLSNAGTGEARVRGLPTGHVQPETPVIL